MPNCPFPSLIHVLVFTPSVSSNWISPVLILPVALWQYTIMILIGGGGFFLCMQGFLGKSTNHFQPALYENRRRKKWRSGGVHQLHSIGQGLVHPGSVV